MQLVLVLETRPSCNSDYRYIKATIDYFYKSRSFSIKPIYAKNKSELLNQNKKINEEMRKYNGQTVVAICADVDKVDDPLNNQLIKYCEQNNYELIWMNINVEHVYLNKIKVKNKEQSSIDFLKHSDKTISKLCNLASINPLNQMRSSNLLYVLDKYLEKNDTEITSL